LSPAGRRIWPKLGLIVAALLGLALAIALFGQGGQDDTYISYWPARTLAERGEIVNYNGLRLEQSSSLSLVLLLALLFKFLPLSMPSVGYLTSLTGAALAGLLAVRLARRMGLGSRLGVLFGIATAPSFGYWATSGMETPWVALFALWFIDELTAPAPGGAGHWARLAAAALLFAGIRPEAPLLLGGLCLTFVALAWLQPKAGERDALQTSRRLQRAGIGLAAIAFVFAFRKLYFDAWWPNPAVIKTGGFDLREGPSTCGTSPPRPACFRSCLFLAGAARIVVAASLRPQLRRGRAGDGARPGAAPVPRREWRRLDDRREVPRTDRAGAGPDRLRRTGGGLPLAACAQRAGGGVLRAESGLLAAPAAPRALRGPAALDHARRDRARRTAHRALPGGARGAAQQDPPPRRRHPERAAPHRRRRRRAGAVATDPGDDGSGRHARLSPRGAAPRSGQHPRPLVADRSPAAGLLPAGKHRPSQWEPRSALPPLAEHEQLEARCGLPLPDIFYNEGLEAHLPKLFKQLGYELIYHQIGRIQNSPGGFFQASYPAFGFIAVKRELAEAIGLRKKPPWRWDLDP
jgi:hypothetical protein